MSNHILNFTKSLVCKLQGYKQVLWNLAIRSKANHLPIMLHSVLWMSSVAFIIPFKITFRSGGYVKVGLPSKLRRWFTFVLHAGGVLHVCMFAGMIFRSDYVGVVDGFLTMDAILWFLLLSAGMATIGDFALVDNNIELLAVFVNTLMSTMEEFSGKYLESQNILRVYCQDPTIKIVCWIVGTTFWLCPLFVTVIITVAVMRGSPLVLATYALATEPHGGLLTDLAIFHDITVLFVAAWIMLSALTVPGELSLVITLCLRTLRCQELDHLSWHTKQRYHARLEILINIGNELAKWWLPCDIMAGLCVAVGCLVFLVRMDPTTIGLPVPLFIWGMGLIASIPSLIGFFVLRFTENMRDESVAFLDELEKLGATEENRLRRRRGVGGRVRSRSFRRRPLCVRVGSFMAVDAGIGASFLQAIIDNAVSYIFMVDPQHKLTLL